jgi:glycosyltransferase involved in cell wall biosynthesis
MKIAFVYDAVYPYRVGGVEKRIAEMSKRLVDKGHEVHIFGLKVWTGDSCFSRDGIYYHGVGETRSFYCAGRRSIIEALYFALKVFSPLYRESFDLIDCQNLPYLHCFTVALMAKLKNTPIIITWHEVWDDYWYEYLGIYGFFGRLIERLSTHLTRKAVAVSKMTRKDLFEINNQLEIKIIPNGIDLKHINEVPPSENVSDVLFSGRLIREKNIDLLIRAIVIAKREFQDIKCFIIGDGPEKSRLHDLAQDVGISDNIRFLGFVETHDEVIALMKSSKIFGSPSIREGFGIAPLEAMACGLPVVTVDARKNAVRELVSKKTGIVCIPTPERFAESIILCIQQRNEMKGDCLQFAADYDWDVIASKAESFYKLFL